MDSFFISGLSGLRRPAAAEPAGFVVLDVFAVQGETGTGFEKAANLGEFECENCLYFDAAAGACNQETMKALSKQPRLADGRVSVGPEDCCEYVKRMGKKDNDNGESTDK